MLCGAMGDIEHISLVQILLFSSLIVAVDPVAVSSLPLAVLVDSPILIMLSHLLQKLLLFYLLRMKTSDEGPSLLTLSSSSFCVIIFSWFLGPSCVQ